MSLTQVAIQILLPNGRAALRAGREVSHGRPGLFVGGASLHGDVLEEFGAIRGSGSIFPRTAEAT
jgi:hypothetical protein